jgi:hypothetical protein
MISDSEFYPYPSGEFHEIPLTDKDGVFNQPRNTFFRLFPFIEDVIGRGGWNSTRF